MVGIINDDVHTESESLSSLILRSLIQPNFAQRLISRPFPETLWKVPPDQ
jgi:hypothetical protein